MGVAARRRSKVAPSPPPPVKAPKPSGYECCMCAARSKQPFVRCLSCGSFKTCMVLFGIVPSARKKPSNEWGGYDLPSGGDQGNPYLLPGPSGAGDDPDDDQGDDDEGEEGDAPESRPRAVAKDFDTVEESDDVRVLSGCVIWDEITCGGPVSGTVSGLTAFPGVGKSTLLLEVAYAYRARGLKVLILALEESSRKVRSRAKRTCLEEKYPKRVTKTGKTKGWIRIVSPLDKVDGESSKQRLARLEHAYAIEDLLASANEDEPDVIILDSASYCHTPALGNKQGTARQLKNTGRTLYERCHGEGRYAGKKPCVGVAVLQSTKEGDSAVPQSFTHAIDATYMGEHVMRDDQMRVVPCRDQKRPTGFVAFRSHGKNRDGSGTAVSYGAMTEQGIRPIDEDEVVSVVPQNDESAEESMQGEEPRKRLRRSKSRR